MKIGLVFTPMHNYKGLTEALWSAKSQNTLETFIQPQWKEPRPALAKAWNDGAQAALFKGCEYALVCNDDILFAPETIDNMVAQYEALRKEGVIMVTPNNIKLQLADPYEILTYECPPDPFTYSEHPNFSCFLIAQEFFGLVGTFDENFYPAWYEDNDMHRRAQLLDYKLIMTTAAPQVHFGGVNTAMMEIADSSRSASYYFEKWGGVPESHPGPAENKERFKTPFNNPALTPKDWSIL